MDLGVEYRCRDERVIFAARERCWRALIDLSTYGRWWTLVRVLPDGGDRLAPGSRFRFSGGRAEGEPVEWTVEVLEIVVGERIELAYTGGEYLGWTAWELADAEPDAGRQLRIGRSEAAGGDGATRVAYVYRGVRPLSDRAAEHFARWGTRVHSIAMQEDALAGLARFLGGPGSDLDDDAWRARVRRRVAAAIDSLPREP